MPTIDELLDEEAEMEGQDESGLVYDNNYQKIDYEDPQIIRIQNKTISDLQDQVTVKGEINSQYIVFEHERYMDGVDLAKMLIQIHYETDNGQKNNSEVVNVQHSDTSIVFGWLIPRSITEKGGTIMFMPFFYGDAPTGEPYLLKDLFATYAIRDGLAVDAGIEEPVEESWYQQFLSDILAVRQQAEQINQNTQDIVTLSELNSQLSESITDILDQINNIGLAINEGDCGLDVIIFSK